MSGVCVCAWMATNCERRAAISVALRPAEARRSKPCGTELTLVRDCGGGAALLGEVGEVGEEGEAADASAARSDGERVVVVVRAQWM